MKKHVSQIIMFIGFLLAALGFVLDPLVFGTSSTMAAMVAATVSLTSIAVILAISFAFAPNKVLNNVGNGLAALVGAYGVGYIATVDISITSIGEIIMLLGAIVYVILQIINFLGFVKNGGDAQAHTAKADVATSLNTYKEMQTSEIITEEEFEALKAKELSSVKVDTVNDLKKWKKLLDQKVITEEEFAGIKANIFKA